MKKGLMIAAVVVIVLAVLAGYLLFSPGEIEQPVQGQGEEPVSQPSDSSEQPTETESGRQAQTHVVRIEGFAFISQTLNVGVGDTVIWTNRDSARHTVTSDFGNELGSKLLGGGESYSHTFNEVGVFDYHCSSHPYMEGKVVVR